MKRARDRSCGQRKDVRVEAELFQSFLVFDGFVHHQQVAAQQLPPVLLEGLAPGIRRVPRIEDALRDADVLMVLRVQTERLHEPALSEADYVLRYQLTPERLRLARPDALVLHPGPMIRGLEIDPAVADGAQSCVLEQVTNGLAIRMALLYHLVGGAPADAPHPAKERSNAAD